MRWYASSKVRIFLLLGLLAAGLFLMSGNVRAQVSSGSTPGASGTAGGNASAPVKPQGVFSLILDNIDPVFCTIAILSIVGMTLIIQGFIKNRASVLMPRDTTEQIREMISQRKFKELIEFTEADPSFVSRALNPALKRAPSFSSMKEAMETAISEQTAEQFRQIEYLNIIGNLGPLLGLLGTVLGMINAFQAMKASGGNAKPADLAGGISQALTHTMLGLMLAVPCLAAFGVLRTIVDRLTVAGSLVAEDLLLMIKPNEAKPAAQQQATLRPGAVPQPTPPPMRKIPSPTPVPSPAPIQ